LFITTSRDIYFHLEGFEFLLHLKTSLELQKSRHALRQKAMDDLIAVLDAIFQVFAEIGWYVDSFAKRIDCLAKSLSGMKVPRRGKDAFFAPHFFMGHHCVKKTKAGLECLADVDRFPKFEQEWLKVDCHRVGGITHTLAP